MTHVPCHQDSYTVSWAAKQPRAEQVLTPRERHLVVDPLREQEALVRESPTLDEASRSLQVPRTLRSLIEIFV